MKRSWIVDGAMVVTCMLVMLQACCTMHVDVAAIDRAKRSADSPQSSGQEAMTRRDMKTWTLIRDLEEAIFNLKEHLLNLDVSASKTGQTDTNVVDPAPEAVEGRHMEDSFPEFTAELHDKKEVHGAGSETKKQDEGDDMSLKEALEFLVSLAKEKKKEERRDRDSFPEFTEELKDKKEDSGSASHH